ncbi:MAG TPA: uroporphyrinogen-III C-methyltransferase, partial [Pyrinomonadaceae bacterium]|nr:uroporphyrinogen-III C-methyltransferase [Pyrinomonadaceae bacterium]
MVGRNSENNITEAVTRRVKRPNDDLNSSIHQNLTSNHEKQIGILVVGHGSRREEANADVREAARLIARRGSFACVEPAFLEIASPTIDDGFAKLVKRGANHVIVHPYFLSPGRHTRGDIPVEVEEAANRNPGVTYQITEPLAAHPSVIDASIERILEMQRTANAERLRKVYLVGAGPGDPGLLTVRALELLRKADVVIYDYLVNPDLLNHLKEDAERIFVGKVGRGTQTPQSKINELLVSKAGEGKLVVRLKGGDPFLFGRGGEEALALRAAGTAFEIVPGISSALAVPAYAGIPLTHRGLSSSIAILTGANAGDGKLSEDLFNARAADSIVVLMGIRHLREITEQLIAVGRSAETPVAVLRWGTYESQQVVTGTLATIAGIAAAESVRPPSIIVIGEVVQLQKSLSWFGEELVEGREPEPVLT